MLKWESWSVKEENMQVQLDVWKTVSDLLSHTVSVLPTPAVTGTSW